MKTVGDHRYRYERGITITLRSITKRSCSCGFNTVDIPRMGPLHRAIAHALGTLKIPHEAMAFTFENGPNGTKDGCWGATVVSST